MVNNLTRYGYSAKSYRMIRYGMRYPDDYFLSFCINKYQRVGLTAVTSDVIWVRIVKYTLFMHLLTK